MDEKDIIKRIEKLENAVFGEAVRNEEDIDNQFADILIKIEKILEPLKTKCSLDDWMMLQAIVSNKKCSKNVHLTSFKTLYAEESDEDIAKLCSALASKQRILILKELSIKKLASGELTAITGMTGGHLHHHLRDLLSLGLIEKEASGKYAATTFGLNAYITAASLHRRLSYDNRENFKENLYNLGKSKK